MIITERTLGFIMAISAAILWGISGTVAQFLFVEKNITPEWLVTIRQLGAGILLTSYAQLKHPGEIKKIVTDSNDLLSLIIFSVFGMAAVQYTYFAAIAHSNAATATVIQYIGPVLIVGYMSYIRKRIPNLIEFIAITFAVIGTYLLVTKGNSNSLAISKQGLIWGICSAIALAFYAIQPGRLLKKYKSAVVVGLGMLIGGVVSGILSNSFYIIAHLDVQAILGILFVIILGSLIPFYIYLSAVKVIGPETAGLLACAEPISAALFAVFWLQVPFGIIEWIGTLLIVSTIFIMTLKKQTA